MSRLDSLWLLRRKKTAGWFTEANNWSVQLNSAMKKYASAQNQVSLKPALIGAACTTGNFPATTINHSYIGNGVDPL
jgi:hypothetical protein